MPLQAHLPGQSLHTGRVERGPTWLPGQRVWRLFLSPSRKKCSSNKKKSVSALAKVVYLQLFWLPISKGLTALRPPLEAGERTSLSGLRVWSLWAWNLFQDFWDCPVSLAAGERVGCDHWNHGLEDLVVYKSNLASEEQSTSVGVEKPRHKQCYTGLVYNTARYSWIVNFTMPLRTSILKLQLPASSSLLFHFSSNPAVLRLCTRADS